MTAKQLHKITFQLVKQNNVRHKFNKATVTAGKDWFYDFMKRHRLLSLLTPELDKYIKSSRVSTQLGGAIL